jgi:hypothetical protein
MMKYLIIIFCLLSGFVVQSQQRFPSGFPTQSNMGWNKWGYSMTDSGLIVANRDTNWLAKYSGTVVFKPSNKKFYWFDSTTLTWNLLNNTIDTTSLSNRINLKLNISDTTGKWLSQATRLVDTMYRVNDSTVGYTIKGAPYTFQILGRSQGGGGGSGTVTSVGLSLPSAFNVTPATITTNGVFAITGAGTTLQYIRGNGTLATTDTGMIPSFYLKVRGLLSGTSPITYNSTTGAIGINNANVTGTKGAASFTSQFSDNGSGLIDLADLVSAGSCTGCVLNINAKGRVTSYSDGAGGGINNTNVGSGFRPVNAITQEMRTYFNGFGQRIDSVANANGLTWSADTTRGSGLPTYWYVDSIASTITASVIANNGLSNLVDSVQLGQTVAAVGNPAALHNSREIPLNGFGIGFSGTGSLGIGTATPSASWKLTVAPTGSTGGINVASGSSGVGVNASSTGNAIVGASTGGSSTGVSGSTSSGGGYGVQGSGGIGGIGGRFYTIAAGADASPVALELERQPTGGGVTNGAGFTIMFRNAFTNGVTGNESGRITNYFSNAVSGSQSSAFGFHLVNNSVSARKAFLASTGQWTWDGYPALTAQVDTTTYKPVAIDGSGNVVKMAGWSGSGGGGSFTTNNIASGFRWVATPSGNVKTAFNSNTILWDSTSNSNGLTAKVDTSVIATQYDLSQISVSNEFTSDIPHLSEIKIWSPAKGTAASVSVANYNFSSVDSAYYKYSTVRNGTAGSEYGGWLAGSANGDSIKVTAPFWVVFGDSQAEGHPGLHGRLHWLLSGVPQNSFKYDYPDSSGQLSYHLRYLMNMRVYNQGIGGQTTVDCRKRFYRDVIGVNSPNSSDGRGDQTLSRKPDGVIIIIGINDIFNGIPAQTTKDNIEWMASQCQQLNSRCVILNLPGDASSGQTELTAIASMNEWLKSGVLDQYGASLVDYNTWWNNVATYGIDNTHHTSLIVDNIHPSKVGYDSLANYIYRQARLPKLRKAAFINELSPTTPINYARPSDITINSDSYTLASINDTIDITTYVPDSVWIKVISSVPVTDNDTTGFSYIVWHQDNNPLDSTFYTRKTLYSGSQKANINASQLTLIPGTAVNGFDILDIPLADLTTVGFRVTTYAGGARTFIGGSTIYNSASLNITNSAIAIGTNGSIYSTGNNSEIAAWQMMTSNGRANNTGVGQSVGNTESSVNWQFNPSPGKDQFRMDAYDFTRIALSSNPTNILAITNTGFNNSGGDNEYANVISLTPTYNHTSTSNTDIQIRGIYYNPTLTALGNARHIGAAFVTGNNYFNTTADSSCFGCTLASNINARFRVNGKFRLDSVSGPPSTYNVLVHGGDSIVYQVPVSAFSGGATLYSADGTLAGNRIVTGSSNSLTFNGISTYRINATSYVLAKNNAGTPYSTNITGTGDPLLFAYTPVANIYSKGVAYRIDTLNNMSIGDAVMGSSAPLYAGGVSVMIGGLQSEDGNFYKVTNITGDATLGVNNNFITVDATSGNITITLPAASASFGQSVGLDMIFKRLDNVLANTVTIQRAGSDLIDGATSFTLVAQYESKSLRAISSSAWALY